MIIPVGFLPMLLLIVLLISSASSLSDRKRDERDRCASVITMNEPSRRDRELPKTMRCSTYDPHHCSITYLIEENIYKDIYKICAKATSFSFPCPTENGRSFDSTITITSSSEIKKIECGKYGLTFLLCSDKDDALFVTYYNSLSCPFDSNDNVNFNFNGNVKIIQQPLSDNLINLVDLMPCNFNTHERSTWKATGTIVADYQTDDPEDKYLCDGSIITPSGAKELCLTFTYCETDWDVANLIIDTGEESKMFSSTLEKGTKTCLKVMDTGKVIIRVTKGVNRVGATFLFDYSFTFDNVKDTDDDDFDYTNLYWLFVIPGAILLFCCGYLSWRYYRYVNEDKTNTTIQAAINDMEPEQRYRVGPLEDESGRNSTMNTAGGDQRTSEAEPTERRQDGHRAEDESVPLRIIESTAPIVEDDSLPPSYDTLFPGAK